jgi:hypothetical protein
VLAADLIQVDLRKPDVGLARVKLTATACSPSALVTFEWIGDPYKAISLVAETPQAFRVARDTAGTIRVFNQMYDMATQYDQLDSFRLAENRKFRCRGRMNPRWKLMYSARGRPGARS